MADTGSATIVGVGMTTAATTGGFGCIIAGSSLGTIGACVHATARNIGANIAERLPTGDAKQRVHTRDRALRRRNKSVITLVFPLKFDEIEIATGTSVRVIAADLRAALVNRTAALALIEEHAH